MADFNTAAGIAGMSIILILFILNGAKKLSPETIIYDAANAIGAFLLVYYAFTLKSWPFLILNSVWGLFSLYEVVKDLSTGKKR